MSPLESGQIQKIRLKSSFAALKNFKSSVVSANLSPEMSAKRPQKRRTDREKASALLGVITNSGNVKKTSRELELPNQTLVNWTQGIGVNADVRRMVEENCLDLALELDSLAFQSVGLLPAKLQGASVRDLVGLFSQAIEKSQLLKGKATNITGSTIEIEQAKQLLEHQLKLNENSPLKLTKYDIYVHIIQRFFSNVSMEALGVESPVSEEESMG